MRLSDAWVCVTVTGGMRLSDATMRLSDASIKRAYALEVLAPVWSALRLLFSKPSCSNPVIARSTVRRDIRLLLEINSMEGSHLPVSALWQSARIIKTIF